MTVKEFYAAIEGDYQEVMTRFPSESFACKFLVNFPEDDSFSLLCDALKEKDYENAFTAAHTLKGICLNLGISALGEFAGRMAEDLRAGRYEQAAGLIDKAGYEYNRTVAAVRELEQQ